MSYCLRRWSTVWTLKLLTFEFKIKFWATKHKSPLNKNTLKATWKLLFKKIITDHLKLTFALYYPASKMKYYYNEESHFIVLVFKRNRTGTVIVWLTIEFLNVSAIWINLFFSELLFISLQFDFKKINFNSFKNVMSHASPKSQSRVVSREL